ncbi:RcnB family protein [Paraburkholderia caledonica]|uniref:RcnB family protein n=1 Tax=Paraburkholderia caledonica TaxID=134536 RepID=UPI000368E6EE|nr:RcnB family protein [Paraburkholderia caledonica]
MIKSRIFLASMMSAGMLASSLVLAQPPHDNPGKGGDHGHGESHGHGPNHGHESNGHGPKQVPPGHSPDGPGNSANAPGHWRKGDRLPPEYRDRQYVIDDWRAYRLAPPPRGYSWVGIGGDYLMVQISTGTVLRVGP